MLKNMKKYFLIGVVFMLARSTLFAQPLLPKGSNPPALEFPYFPNKAYAVVWRNWNMVEPARQPVICKTNGV